MNTSQKHNRVIHLEDFNLIISLPCGGKAKGLSRLLAEGARVPSGIVVVGDVSEKETEAAINNWLNKIEASGTTKARYAVRSSAMCEDGQQQSFAGMFDTFLNVDARDILTAVQKCQNSAQNRRLKVYSEVNPNSSKRVAVVIQEMVSPRSAGVCFTANPVTKNVNEAAVEAVKGLGERLVNGTATPELWRLDPVNNVVEIQRGEDALEGPTILAYWEVLELVNEARRLAIRFGYPLDIEFAFANGELFILQARPITTLNKVA
jgi:pyruvate,water dikinase